MSSGCDVEHNGLLVRAWFQNDFQTYRLGDKVPCEREFRNPGKWIDGLHEAEAESDERPYWVVIKDQRIRDVILAVRDGQGAPGHCQMQRELLESAFQIVPPPKDWWPELAWEAQAWRKQLAEQQTEARRKRYVDRYVEQWRKTHAQREAERKADRELGDKLYTQACQDVTGKPPSRAPQTEAQALNEYLFEQMCREPQTEEEAREAAERSFPINDFTWTKMRETGILRRLFGPYEVREDLTSQVTELLKGWRDWNVPEEMLYDAVAYKVERGMREAGTWDSRKHWIFSFERPGGELTGCIKELVGEERLAE